MNIYIYVVIYLYIKIKICIYIYIYIYIYDQKINLFRRTFKILVIPEIIYLSENGG